MGTVSKPVKVAIKKLREQGIKAGMLRIRWFRPFPTQEVVKYLSGARVVCVIDRDYSLGSPYRGGVVYHEVRSSLYDLDARPKVLSFIGGLGGREITIQAVGEGDQDRSRTEGYSSHQAHTLDKREGGSLVIMGVNFT